MKNRIIVFDFDDTLVYTNEIFLKAKSSYYQYMRKLGLYDDDLPRVLNDFDITNVKEKGGLKKECFPLALQQAYEYYCQIKSQPISAAQRDDFWTLGYNVYQEPAKAVPGARELLSELKDSYSLILLTQGDQDLQKARIEESGFVDFFESYYIVHRKDAGDYMRILADYQADPSVCWSIGNSIRYDVNPALLAGLNVIHIDIPCWDFEHVEPLGSFFSVKRLEECRQYLL